jgi:hypothetical protein
MTDATADRELGWEDEISKEGADFITLPGDDYPFRIIGLSRERYEGGEKMGPCPKAVVEVEFDGGTLGKVTIKENLFLHTKTEGILCSFFASVGQRKHGDKQKMDWGRVIGSTGRATLGIRSYETNGEQRTINQVKKWLAPTVAADNQPANFTPGQFG